MELHHNVNDHTNYKSYGNGLYMVCLINIHVNVSLVHTTVTASYLTYICNKKN